MYRTFLKPCFKCRTGMYTKEIYSTPFKSSLSYSTEKTVQCNKCGHSCTDFLYPRCGYLVDDKETVEDVINMDVESFNGDIDNAIEKFETLAALTSNHFHVFIDEIYQDDDSNEDKTVFKAYRFENDQEQRERMAKKIKEEEHEAQTSTTSKNIRYNRFLELKEKYNL